MNYDDSDRNHFEYCLYFDYLICFALFGGILYEIILVVFLGWGWRMMIVQNVVCVV